MPIRVQSLDHVTIVIKDLAATRRFYVDLLGMKETTRPNFSFPGQWFQAGATLIHANWNPKNLVRRETELGISRAAITLRFWSMTVDKQMNG